MDLDLHEHWQKLDAIFDEALARPPDERTAFLRARCGEDPKLYTAVAALLEEETEAEKVLGESVTEFAALLLPGLGDALANEAAAGREDLAEGTRVGPYQIVAEIGRGGMGAVYRATRADGAFEKEVALKLVKRGMDTDEVLRRFRYERQVLAGLEHPHIARLLDAGAASDGRPFLVMELVEGEPVTDYCDRRRLDLEARLRLFEQVVDAVRYAHRRLVVHRDLKPGNVLVTEDEEGNPHVKLLDFGIAKLLEPQSEDALTQPHQRLLTPAYAAPEQREGEPTTTAADVYALGVVLCELLAGQRPGEKARTPESLVTPQAAQARGTTADALRRQVRGDLGTLVLTALHLDPARRYASAEAMMDELSRLRSGLPLKARPVTLGYRLQKFVGRHRVGVGISLLGLVALAVFVVVLGAQQRHTRTALAEAEATAEFLESLFSAADPFSTERLDTLRASDLLARGVERAREDLTEEPALRARILSLIGAVYVQLDLQDEARPLLEEAMQDRLQLFGPGHLNVAETRHTLAIIDQLQGHYEASESNFTEAITTFRDELGPEHPTTLKAIKELAYLYENISRYDEAEVLLRELVTVHRRRGDDQGVGGALHALGLVLRDQERFADAEIVLRESLELQRRVYGNEHPNIAATLGELGAVLRGKGDLEGAERAYRESLEMRRELLGESHRETEIGRTHLAELLKDKGAFREAAALYGEVLERTRAQVGIDHPGVGIMTALLAGVYLEAGDFVEAEAGFREALTRMGEALPAGHVRVARAEVGLGAALLGLERYAEAEEALLKAYSLFREGGHDPDRAVRRLIELYEATGRTEEALGWRNRAAALGPAGSF